MTIGFVLFHVSRMHEKDIWKNLMNTPEVIQIHPISGQ
jgi:hypothetical protein